MKKKDRPLEAETIITRARLGHASYRFLSVEQYENEKIAEARSKGLLL